MKPIEELLSQLRHLQVKLWLDKGRLRYSAPQGTMTPELLAQMKERKGEILAFLERINPDKLKKIKPVSRNKKIPLSFAQQRVWFLDQLEGQSSAYNMPMTLCLNGNLNLIALEQSLQTIIERHEILRTNFATGDGTPLTIIHPTSNFSLSVIDLQNRGETEQEKEVQKLINQEYLQPFDLEKDSLIRANLLKLKDQDHILMLTLHHIISDGWSMNLLREELGILYSAFSQGNACSLPDLPIQYADFAYWQREELAKELSQKHLPYWKKQLAGAPPLLELPLDHPRPTVQTFTGGKHVQRLSQSLSEKMKKVTQKEGVTLFMTLLAAFKVLLYRYTGVEDLVVGTPVAGRNHSEVERLIGFFINTVVLRTHLDGNPSFRELLGRVKEVTLGAYEHQEMPFEKLVEELQPERSLSQNPLFQVWFNMVNLKPKELNLPELNVEFFPIQEADSKFDITLYVRERPQGIKLDWVYNRDLFNPETIAGMTEHFQTLLEGIVDNPERKLTELPRPKLPNSFPDLATVIPQPDYELVTNRFATWVNQAPEQTAVSQSDRSKSYLDLSQSAHSLAQLLLGQELQRGDVVAICGRRSFGLIAAVLGVLLSGGVLLMIDPNLPRERQQLMLTEAKTKYLVYIGTQYPTEELGEYVGSITLNPETGEAIEQGSQQTSTDLPNLLPGDAAYIFFTSGTTGIPKEVLGTHQGLAHFLHWQRETFAVKPTDRSAQLTGLSFDVVLRDIFLPLTSGATLCLPPSELNFSGASILPWLEQERISLLHTVPTLAQSWLMDLPTDISLRTLRWLFFAGEPLTDTLVRQWREKFPESGQIVNLYGPTETTLAKCFYIVPEELSAGVQPIGSPLPETQALILAKNQQLCSPREAGEIVLRTPFRSKGYINASEENQQKFIANRYRNDEEDLLYYTGDRGYYRQDGLIEILGRIDDQVKIRGIRIEPQEVANVLNQHPRVKQTAVIAREERPGNKRLVAYFVADSEQSIAELRSFLKAKLPEYMIPSAFVQLEQLPLTPNGKVDRRALPEPEIEDTLAENFVAPRNSTEEQLATIWASVLGLEKVGIYNNFFELGGHSLLVTQVISRIRHAFEVELPLRVLFQLPTIAELAESIETFLPAKSTRPASIGKGLEQPKKIKPIPRDQNIPPSFAQQRVWFLDQLEGQSSAYNMPMTLRLKGNLNAIALEQSLQAIIERHEILRTNFATRNGAPLTIIHHNSNFSLSMIDLQNLGETEQEKEVQQLINQERLQPFDLEKDSLIRANLLKLKDQDHVLMLTLHHIISDAWSMNLLREELSIFYSALSQGNSYSLPDLPIQYADFAYWQREELAKELSQKHLPYWKKQLAGAPPLLELPLDHPRPTVQTFTGGKHTQRLSQSLSERMKKLSQKEGVTLFMTLLAAFKVLLYRYTGVEDLVVGTPVAGRNHSEVERLIGFFINTVVLRTYLDGNPSFRELLGRVKEVTLGAYEHQEMPFEKLVEELQPQRSLSHNPLFQVWFNMVNLKSKALELPDLNVELLSSSQAASKFDITLYLLEKPEGITLQWVYNRDLFNPATLEGMAERFQTLLESIVAEPTRPISNLSVLGLAEHQRLPIRKNLVTPNKTFTEFPQAAIEQSISARLEEQVRKSPNQVAIQGKHQQWTYSVLNQKVNAIATIILERCGDTPQRIALLLEHDEVAIAAILGVLKAGKTYIPLDPTYPQPRLTYILEDAQATAILTNKENLALAQELTLDKIHLLNIEEIDLEKNYEEFNCSTSPDTPAYILYTSGSTGQPKGVVQNHRNVLHFIRNYTNNLHIAPEDKLTLLASYSFDAAVMDIFGALLNGATLCPFAIKAEGLDKLSSWLVEQEITIYHSTPTVYRYFLDTLLLPTQGKKTPFLRIRLVVLGGEEVLKKDVELYKDYFSEDCIFVNGLGCTESSFNLQYLINHDTKITGEVVPVGYPFEETEILLLNQAGFDAQIYGEIAVRSPYIALGYWQKPELTQAAFLPAPDGGNRRIYRTGDLGRLRADGAISFLGRRDFQVKIRGFRIELGEIETTLEQHSSVQEAVVIAAPDNSDNKQLVAYLVPKPESNSTSEELRYFLQQRLPNYMIPAVFVMLDALPLTPNGKVNRRALPSPMVTKAKPGDTAIAPRDELELQLTRIWEKVLNIKPIEITDNFFNLGGHSLLALQLFSEINKRIGQDIPLATLFQAPTVAELAKILRKEGWSPSWSSLVPVKTTGSKPPFFFHSGAADAMTWSGFGRRLPVDQPFYGLQLPGLDGKHKFQGSVEEIVADCLREIRTLQPEGPYFIGGHCFGGTIAFEMAQQLRTQGEEVALLALVDAYAPQVVPQDNLLWRTQALFHKWDFLLYKTYYYHADELKKRPLIGKLSYLANWLGEKAKGKLQAKVKRKSSRRSNNGHDKAPKPENASHSPPNAEDFVPYEIRYRRAHQANRAAKAKYDPQAYPGKAIVFRAKKQTLDWHCGRELGWNELVEGKLECHDIPGLFGNLFNQASLPLLVEAVQVCLDKAQTDKED